LSPLYELAFGGGLKWWRPSWKELSFSVPNHADKEVSNILTSVDHLLIEILLSRPINILQIYELLSMGVFVMYIYGLCHLMCKPFILSPYACFACLLRTCCRYIILGQSAK
jgi:hypothetical protein